MVAQEEATTTSLEAYLDSMGVTTFSSNRLAADALPAVEAVVLFPDGFQDTAIAGFLGELRHTRPELPLVVVTSQTQAYAPLPHKALTAVLPRPTFAWGILDALRLLYAESAGKAKK